MSIGAEREQSPLLRIAIMQDESTRTCWQILGIPATATVTEIKQAYYRRALELHPDHGGSAAAFVALQDAYQEALALQETAATKATATKTQSTTESAAGSVFSDTFDWFEAGLAPEAEPHLSGWQKKLLVGHYWLTISYQNGFLQFILWPIFAAGWATYSAILGGARNDWRGIVLQAFFYWFFYTFASLVCCYCYASHNSKETRDAFSTMVLIFFLATLLAGPLPLFEHQLIDPETGIPIHQPK